MSTWSQRVLAELGKQKRNTEGGLSSHRWGLGWGWSQAERYAVPGLTLKGLMERWLFLSVPILRDLRWTWWKASSCVRYRVWTMGNLV